MNSETHPTSHSSRRALLAATAALCAPRPVRAEAGGADWPTRTVRYINAYPAGGPTDTLSRIWCTRMSEITGHSFIVENRSGSGGIVGADAIAKSAPDGYTIGLGGIAIHVIAPMVYPSVPYDPERNFTFISGLYQLPNLLAVHLDVPARSLPELIALLKLNPGRYSYASSGSGTTPHLSGELFKTMARVDILHVPYRGSAPAQIDLVTGRVSMMFDNIPGTLALSQQGKVRPLAVTSLERSPAAPEIPAISEILPGFEIVSWGCLCGPAGLSSPVVRRISALTRLALESPDLGKAYSDLGANSWWTTPEDLVAYRVSQQTLLAPLVRASGARVD
jgi:tripartite-type tricarboxylate transporter receptor subunit TctC